MKIVANTHSGANKKINMTSAIMNKCSSNLPHAFVVMLRVEEKRHNENGHE